MQPIKRILVPVIGDQSEQSALEAAAHWAARFQARISVVFFKFDPIALFEPLTDYPYVTVDAVEDIAAKQDAHVAGWHKRFEEWAERAQMPTGPGSSMPRAEWSEETGRERERLVHWAKLSDLVVMPVPGKFGTGRLQMMAEAALFEAGRPVLFVPAKLRESLDRAIVAWDGSREAGRAVAAALPLLRHYRHAELFTRRELRKPEAQPEDMLAYLSDHGIEAALDEASPGSADIAAELLQRCTAVTAGLLVMGAFSHSRFRETIFGGVTRHVLEQSPVSVLMCH